ncbi:MULTISPECIES: universal stress protein [Burkholderia cepacia complex]|uniref:universal stress protein n=1 Tax=Burkholderia cepacia complex TaxID=87882 RepID=UPI00087FD80A|nr:universal stress protein [Burkholderia cenocepacia]SDR57300.1 Nucleotide-binding universal stress protein, UspA family [Burkholderia orbicola]AQQ28321.1 universal stress protein UspA [Burkholderia cenocepacia]MBR8322697.1 universal stress protein [Burkholderia cenocepacia]ONV87490.1 universal stress protein UspA [Burkholderia cenocepacia]ONV95999.1 universal stress protein UspA [Burkholderia cenocepacia]
MYEKIMVAVDGSASSKQALAEAVKVALAGDTHVSVVYVVDKSVLFTYAGRLDPHALVEEIRDDGRKVLREAEQIIALAGAKGEAELVETESIGEDIAERLQRYVKERGIDLAVVGTHGRRGIRRVLLGSVAERFVRGSKCPVLLIRGDDADESAAAATA